MLQGPWVVRPDVGLSSPEPEPGPFATLSESFSDHTPSSNRSLVSGSDCHNMPQTAIG